MIRQRIASMIRRATPQRRRKVAPLPLLEAIQVDDEEVVAVLAELQREIDMEQAGMVTFMDPRGIVYFDGSEDSYPALGAGIA